MKVVQFNCNVSVFGFVSSEWLIKDKDWTGSEMEKNKTGEYSYRGGICKASCVFAF